jgi:hypothetical protein
MSYRTVEGDNEYYYGTCDRCGFEWKFPQTYAQRATYSMDVCKDCRAKPVTHSGPANDYCLPWQGDVDLDTMAPLDDDGNPYKPGIRTCGNADCIRPKHLISEVHTRTLLRRLGLPIPSTLL